MERMKKKKKEIRLRTFFVRFLRKLVAAVLLAFLLWLLQITVSVGTGLILPANAAEKRGSCLPSHHRRTYGHRVFRDPIRLRLRHL